jgi:hypothetical protein
MSSNVGLSRAHGASECDVTVEARIVNGQLDGQRQIAGHVPVSLVPAVLADNDLAVAQGFEARPDDASGERVQSGRLIA